MADKEIKAYEGIYLYDDSWAAIGKKDNEYHFFTDWTYAKMYFISPTGFFNEEFQANKNMIKDEKGNVVGYTRMVGEKEYPRALKVINPDTTNLSNQFYGDIGWYYFETKKYKEALTYFSRGTQVYPEDLNMLVNRAHMYLFNNEYNKARDIYKAHLTNIVRPGYSWEDLMREDYTYFKDKKYDMQLFDRVFDELKVKKP